MKELKAEGFADEEAERQVRFAKLILEYVAHQNQETLSRGEAVLLLCKK